MNSPSLPASTPDTRDDNDTLDLTAYLDFLLGSRWLITSVAFAVTVLGAAYAFLATPIYDANILVQVEDSATSSSNLLSGLAGVFDLKTPASAEIEILRSRFVLNRALENAGVYIDVKPKRFPIIGSSVARRNQELSEPGLFGWDGYTWGIEQAGVSVFNVPEVLEDRVFILTAAENGSFHVTQNDGGINLVGKVGQMLKAHNPAGDIELRVDRMTAKPGAQFRLIRVSRQLAIERLQGALAIVEKGKQSGVIAVSLQGPDPQLVTRILNEIGFEYVRQNVDRKSEEAKKSLTFLDRHLPEVKKELDTLESRYNELRKTRGTIDLNGEAKALLEQSVQAQIKLSDLKQNREALLVRFQQDHPAVNAVDQQIKALESAARAIEEQIKRMPGVEQDVFRLTRDVKVNTDLYTGLLQTAQQLRLIQASKIGNVRLIDQAVKPIKTVKPKRLIVVALSMLIGLFLGVISAFVRKSLFGRIDDPHTVEEALGLSVSATVPHSARQEQLSSPGQQEPGTTSLLAMTDPSDPAIESLRSFRASLQFSMLNAHNNIVMITGPTPGIGKSFLSANIAAVLASTGKRVLLIDGDMRRGKLHTYFARPRTNGLAEAIGRGIAPERAIHAQVAEGVDFLACGAYLPKPGDLLGHHNFGEMLGELSPRYDFVLIDTPPVLAVSDAAIIGAHAGLVFGIARSGITTLGELEAMVKQLQQAGSAVTGIIFNDLQPRHTAYRYGGKYQHYKYANYNY
jgi:tyrosine-protein kinase Etk/Wzc